MARCPFCRSEIEVSEMISCSECGSQYHADCWQAYEGCSVFGCSGTMLDLQGGMARVFTAPLLPSVQNMKNHLEINGIRSYITNEYLSAALGEIPWTECWPQLCVRDRDAGQAREMIEEYIRAEGAMTSWNCPNCHEELEGQFSQCWNCGTVRRETGQ